MSMSHLDKIRVVLAEPNVEFRASLKEKLEGFGLTNIFATGNLSHVEQAVNRGDVDMLIGDTILPEGDFNQYVHQLRHGQQGSNPFLVTITMVNEPSSQAVHAAIDSGTDHVLAKPFSAETLIERIAELTHARKRFVVTTDYIGPDRRATHRAGTMEIPLIDVPNPLHHCISGHMSAAQIRHTLALAKLKINEQKVQRHAYQIGWLLDHVMPELAALKEGALAEDFENLHRLSDVVHDMCARIKGTRFAHVAEICMTLKRMAEDALREGLGESDMLLMGRMAALLEQVFDPNREANAEEYQRKARARKLSVFHDDDARDLTRKELSPQERAAVAAA